MPDRDIVGPQAAMDEAGVLVGISGAQGMFYSPSAARELGNSLDREGCKVASDCEAAHSRRQADEHDRHLKEAKDGELMSPDEDEASVEGNEAEDKEHMQKECDNAKRARGA